MRAVVASGTTDVGRVRDINEDALLLADGVFAVADGMGGHLAGEVASATALQPIQELEGKVFADAPDAAEALREAVLAANATVSDLAQREPSYRGMGTTLTAALIEGRRLHVAHVGDSRAYLLRGGQFSQLTDDHTLVQHLIDEGQITREEAANHPQRSIITRAIGVSPEVDVDSLTLDLEPGDQLLLCSDGLTGVVSDEIIANRLAARDDAEDTIAELVRLANEAGGTGLGARWDRLAVVRSRGRGAGGANLLPWLGRGRETERRRSGGPRRDRPHPNVSRVVTSARPRSERMKKDIHPKIVPCKIVCDGEVVLETYSTKPEIHVDVWSGNHPFFTGQQRFIDTEGRVEKFQKRFGTSYRK